MTTDSKYFTTSEAEAARHLLFREGHSEGWEPGSFSYYLVEALARADSQNRSALLSAFPAYTRPLAIMMASGANRLASLLNTPKEEEG